MNTSARYNFDQYLILFSVFFAFIVVLLGAFCRLADSGLGCPDWPGCYGHMVSVPISTTDVAAATASYPGMPPLAPERMWPEMVHRYFAGTLGFLVFFILFRVKRAKNSCINTAILASSIVIFQAVLGMWTVTWKLLPTVVMGHLLGGFALTSLLWWIFLSFWVDKKHIVYSSKINKAACIMFAIVFLQIFLGGWTSSNYAALICPDFPFCRGSLFPAMDLSAGFKFIVPIGLNYEFGLLGEKARIAIQMMHRWGALVTSCIILSGGIFAWYKSNSTIVRSNICFIFIVLFLQLLLGILNIKMLLPIEIAVAHNGMGLLLLLSCLTLYFLSKK